MIPPPSYIHFGPQKVSETASFDPPMWAQTGRNLKWYPPHTFHFGPPKGLRNSKFWPSNVSIDRANLKWHHISLNLQNIGCLLFLTVKACIHWIFTFLQKTWMPFRGSLHTKIPNYRKNIIKTQFLCFFTLNTSFCKKIWFFENHVIAPEKHYEKSVKTSKKQC